MNASIQTTCASDGFLVNDMRCVSCGHGRLEHRHEYKPATIVCQSCGREYGQSFGVHFFGNFENEDVLGLIEIAANIVNRGHFGITPAAVEEWEGVLSQYHAAADKPAFLRTVSPDKAPYFLNRYN